MSDSSRRSPVAVVPGRTVVVALPAEIDVSNQGEVREALTRALVTRPEVVVADGTRTVFCDCAAISALIWLREQAASEGAELRVVISSQRVLRVFELIGVEQVLPVYPSVEEATIDGSPPP